MPTALRPRRRAHRARESTFCIPSSTLSDPGARSANRPRAQPQPRTRKSALRGPLGARRPGARQGRPSFSPGAAGPRMHLHSGFRTCVGDPAPRPEGFSPVRPQTPICAVGAPTLGREVLGARRSWNYLLRGRASGASRGVAGGLPVSTLGGASICAWTVGPRTPLSLRRVPASQVGEVVWRKRQNRSRYIFERPQVSAAGHVVVT